jgi:dolichol kinase
VAQDLNLFEVAIASLFYQVILYVGLRLAHGGFTLGELGVVCFGGTSLCLEFLNITIAKVIFAFLKSGFRKNDVLAM